MKNEILKNLCYTELVYARINKKLGFNIDKIAIENLILSLISDNSSVIEKIGKNYYVKNYSEEISVTINSYTYRVITVNRF
ncbi:DUF3781 domain-containing protein [Floricoccus penangensis]|uniref:DUF3781 domain-containing protein n=1 Tax=Floricoccus penangensis TaxID=1859475 RepID=UPI00203D9DC9|nr:DUF3781 domain-containing protein [Floricoccus penangensis]URZ87539.1 DUF3781 domain-containing protein [Floricoccus penangensis]